MDYSSELQKCIQYLQSVLRQNNIDYDKSKIPQYLTLLPVSKELELKRQVFPINQKYEIPQSQYQEVRQLEDGSQYLGQWLGYKKNGKGQQYIPQNNVLNQGYWIDDQFVFGNQISVDELYEGQFKNGEWSGQGQLFTKDMVYGGEFLMGVFEGSGKLKSKGNHSYVGKFKNGKYHGFGKLETQDMVFEGDFFEGKIQGKGKLIQNGVESIGSFVDGQLEGEGLMIKNQNDYYSGEFKKGLRWGFGTMKREGMIFRGQFKEGFLDGAVKLQDNGRIYNCYYSDGVEDLNKRILTDEKNM